MINILPPEEKNRLLLEERKKLAIIFWLLLLFFLFCFTLILFSIKFYLKGQLDYQKVVFQENQKKTEQSEIQLFQEKFKAFNIALIKLDNFYKQKVYFSDILEKISKILPPEAYLTNLSANISSDENEKSIVKITLSGYIPTRDQLFDFKKNLEKEKGIQEVSFPPNNWVNPTDINFLVNFKINK